MTRRTKPKVIDEKGQRYATEASGATTCLWCATEFPTRSPGRRPLYCGPACRIAAHRSVKAYEMAVQEAAEAQSRAQAKIDAAFAAVQRGADTVWYVNEAGRLAREALIGRRDC